MIKSTLKAIKLCECIANSRAYAHSITKECVWTCFAFNETSQQFFDYHRFPSYTTTLINNNSMLLCCNVRQQTKSNRLNAEMFGKCVMCIRIATATELCINIWIHVDWPKYKTVTSNSDKYHSMCGIIALNDHFQRINSGFFCW